MLEICNFTTNRIDKKFLQEAAEAVFEIINKEKTFPKLSEGGRIEISLAIVGNAQMRKLNKMYRGKNRVTDVLSFGDKLVSNLLKNKSSGFVEAPDKINRLGEIIICYPRAKKQAKESGHSFKREVSILLIHGILHLLGYDHEESDAQAEEMQAMENKILLKIHA